MKIENFLRCPFLNFTRESGFIFLGAEAASQKPPEGSEKVGKESGHGVDAAAQNVLGAGMRALDRGVEAGGGDVPDALSKAIALKQKYNDSTDTKGRDAAWKDYARAVDNFRARCGLRPMDAVTSQTLQTPNLLWPAIKSEITGKHGAEAVKAIMAVADDDATFKNPPLSTIVDLKAQYDTAPMSIDKSAKIALWDNYVGEVNKFANGLGVSSGTFSPIPYDNPIQVWDYIRSAVSKRYDLPM